MLHAFTVTFVGSLSMVSPLDRQRSTDWCVEIAPLIHAFTGTGGCLGDRPNALSSKKNVNGILSPPSFTLISPNTSTIHIKKSRGTQNSATYILLFSPTNKLADTTRRQTNQACAGWNCSQNGWASQWAAMFHRLVFLPTLCADVLWSFKSNVNGVLHLHLCGKVNIPALFLFQVH